MLSWLAVPCAFQLVGRWVGTLTNVLIQAHPVIEICELLSLHPYLTTGYDGHELSHQNFFTVSIIPRTVNGQAVIIGLLKVKRDLKNLSYLTLRSVYVFTYSTSSFPLPKCFYQTSSVVLTLPPLSL